MDGAIGRIVDERSGFDNTRGQQRKVEVVAAVDWQVVDTGLLDHVGLLSPFDFNRIEIDSNEDLRFNGRDRELDQ